MLNRIGSNKHYDQGIRLFDEGRYESAIEAFQAALAEPKGAALTARLARFYLAESYHALARAQMDAPGVSLSSAIENLKAALALSPNYADLHFNLGGAYLLQKQYTEALAAFDQAIFINSDYARAHIKRALTLHYLGRDTAALRAAENASMSATATPSATLPPDFHALFAQVRQAHASGDAEAIGDLLQRMGRDDPDEARRHADRGLRYFQQGLLKEAIEECQQAVRAAPRYPDFHNQLGVMLYAARRDEEASQEFTQALDINPRYLEARLNRGLALLRLGGRDLARRDFTNVLEQEPDNQTAWEHLNAVDSGASPP